ncbi:MAG: ParA family protein [Ruminococcus sp.]|nr:ParA family protein [Ruminococcus sp.]
MKKKIKRSRSVQVRLTQEEYDFLEQKFKLSGYKSKSEFMRIAFFDTLVVKFSTEDMTQLIMSFYAGTPVTAETAQKAIRHSETAGVDYIPSDINLANAETLMVTMISKEHILRRILTEDVVGAYDFVLIDCLPSLGTLLINALTAADRVLIPVQTQKFSMDGLQSLEALTQLVKANTNPKLNLIGVLPTMVDRTKVSRTAIDTLNEKYGAMLFRTSISKSIEAAKSSENGTPLCLTGHKLGQEYDELAQEVLSRC